jgi:hypothetical protein
MATVNWPNLEKGYNDATQSFQDYGFDLRDILLTGVALPSFINPNGTGFHNLETAHGFTTTDKFTGSFVVMREGVEYGTPPATIFIGSEWVESGTITSFTRSAGDTTLGTIEGLQLDYLQAAAAALTADKSDDMALWAQAFAGNDFLSGSNGADRLKGFSGDDTMLGGAANDTLDGALGFDSLDGGAGNDILYGVDGNDQLLGGIGNDTMDGGVGFDFLNGGMGTTHSMAMATLTNSSAVRVLTGSTVELARMCSCLTLSRTAPPNRVAAIRSMTSLPSRRTRSI